MMNEFPPKYLEVMREAFDSDTAPANVTEYLEYLESIGIKENDFPAIQPILQERIWDRLGTLPTPSKPSSAVELEKVLDQLRKEDQRFNMEGGSWTNNISWVRGYGDVLGPIEQTSATFAEKTAGVGTPEHRYRNALFHLLTTQTSCYRYWGTGLWTDYARELCRRTNDILRYDFTE
jgi:hypothetical protein